MFELKMPKLGESVTEGTIGKWLKRPGEKVNKYDLLVEVQTDKVNTEIPSPVSGTLREVKVEEGQTVPIGTLLAVFDTADESVAASPAAGDTPASSQPQASAPRTNAAGWTGGSAGGSAIPPQQSSAPTPTSAPTPSAPAPSAPAPSAPAGSSASARQRT